MTTAVRVVCWNTLTFALGNDLKGGAGAFRMPHSMDFDEDMQRKAKEALGLSRGQMDIFKEQVLFLSKKKAKPEDVESFFCEVLRYDPNADEKKREPRLMSHLRDALISSPGADLSTATGTWWGAVNAVTYVIDHEMGRDRSTALRNAWIGKYAGYKRDAMEFALKRAA